MATAGLRLLEDRAREAILASCRDVLRAAGFRFEDAWAKVIPGSAAPLAIVISFWSQQLIALWIGNGCLNGMMTNAMNWKC